jgi:hypothetical protein
LELASDLHRLAGRALGKLSWADRWDSMKLLSHHSKPRSFRLARNGLCTPWTFGSVSHTRDRGSNYVPCLIPIFPCSLSLISAARPFLSVLLLTPRKSHNPFHVGNSFVLNCWDIAESDRENNRRLWQPSLPNLHVALSPLLPRRRWIRCDMNIVRLTDTRSPMGPVLVAGVKYA